MWRYFDVGEGIFQPYLVVKFVSGIKIIKDFSKTDAGAQSKTNSKQRDGRGLKNLLFCNEVGCSEVFTDQEEYDKHLAEGRHTNGVEKTTAMDKVRRSFTSRMKVSSQKYMSDGGIELEDADVLSGGEECQTMSMFSNVGWALPVRSTFRYSSKQKKVLYD